MDDYKRDTLAGLIGRIEELENALHAAFMAMCDQRDNPDGEVFQDAIDALGMAASAKTPTRITGAANIVDEAACLIWSELCPDTVMGDEDRPYYEAAAKAVLALSPQGASTREEAWSASTHDEIIKRLMTGVGMPNSNSLYGAFKQFANELHALAHTQSQREAVIEECAKVCEGLRHVDYPSETSEWSSGTFDCAQAVRALRTGK